MESNQCVVKRGDEVIYTFDPIGYDSVKEAAADGMWLAVFSYDPFQLVGESAVAVANRQSPFRPMYLL